MQRHGSLLRGDDGGELSGLGSTSWPRGRQYSAGQMPLPTSSKGAHDADHLCSSCPGPLLPCFLWAEFPARQASCARRTSALQQAAAEVQDVFGKDIASAKTSDERTALAKQMLTAAKTGSAANAFKLLETAASLLASPDSSKPPKRNIPLFLDAIDQWTMLPSTFHLRPLRLRCRKATTVLSEDDARSFYERIRPWLDDALRQDD